MKIKRSQVRKIIQEVIRNHINEAPLAWGEDEETGEKKPSISMPSSEDERLSVYDDLLNTEIGDDNDSALTKYRSTENSLDGDDLTDSDIDDLKIKDEEISKKYREIMLSSGNVKRVDRQFEKFPYDVHFVILPQMIGGEAYWNDLLDGYNFFSSPLNLSYDKSFSFNRDSLNSTADNSLFNKVPGFLSRFGVLMDGKNDRFEKFITNYIKEKTGAIVKTDDVIFVNFLNFRYTAWDSRRSEKANILNIDVKEIKKTISKKFYFLDSLYMIIHNLFDGGPFQGFSQLPSIEAIEMLLILSKYNVYLRSLLGTYLNYMSPNEKNKYVAFDGEYAQLNDGWSDIVKSWNAGGPPQDQFSIIKKSVGKETTPDSGYIRDNSSLVKKQSEGDNSNVIDIFNVKSIKNGLVNSGFDFYSEMLTYSTLTGFFPISIKKLKALDIDEHDKKRLIEIMPLLREYIKRGVSKAHSLRGKTMIGSSTDQFNYAN